MYRSPNGQRENITNLVNLLRKISSKRFSHLVIMGDFNFKEIDWNKLETTKSENHISSLFLKGIKDTFFFQHCKEPTRYRQKQEPSLLDLIFTNEENMIEKVNYLPSLRKSDHLVLMFQYNCCIENNIIYLKSTILIKVITVHVEIYWAQWTGTFAWTDQAFLNHGQALQK